MFERKREGKKSSSTKPNIILAHTCLSLRTYIPSKVAFHIRLILSRRAASFSIPKIKFFLLVERKLKERSANRVKRKKRKGERNGLRNETISHFERVPPSRCIKTVSFVELREIPISIRLRVPRRYPVHRAIMSRWTIKYTWRWRKRMEI